MLGVKLWAQHVMQSRRKGMMGMPFPTACGLSWAWPRECGGYRTCTRNKLGKIEQ